MPAGTRSPARPAATKATKAAARKAPPPPAQFQPAETAAEPPTRMVDGKKVVRVEPIRSPLSLHFETQGRPPVYFKGVEVLFLEDDTQVFGCTDCPTTGAGRGDIQKHRVAEHGAGKSGPGSPPKPAKAAEPALSTNVLSMPLGELLLLARSIEEIELEHERLQDRLDQETARRMEAETTLRKLTRALAKAGFTPKLEDE